MIRRLARLLCHVGIHRWNASFETDYGCTLECRNCGHSSGETYIGN